MKKRFRIVRSGYAFSIMKRICFIWFKLKGDYTTWDNARNDALHLSKGEKRYKVIEELEEE